MVEWQHRTAKEFAVDRKCVSASATAKLNEQTQGVLGKCRCLRCGQPLSVNLDQKVFEFLEDETDRCSYVSSQLLYWSVIYEHLGVAPEVGTYSRDKMSDPAYKPPLCFRLALRLQNGGCMCGTLR